MKIPKKIFIFWNDPNNIPKFVNYNIDLVKRNNPDYEVFFLNKNNFEEFINIQKYNFDFKDKILSTPMYLSDILRFLLLSVHGGVWIDASCILWKPLDCLLHPDDTFVIFNNKHNVVRGTQHAFESWFIAAVPEHPFIESVKDVVVSLNNFCKIKIFLDTSEVVKQLNTTKYYHFIYHVINFVCQTCKHCLRDVRMLDTDIAYTGHMTGLPGVLYFINFSFVMEKIISNKIKYFLEDEKNIPKHVVISKLTAGVRKQLR